MCHQENKAGPEAECYSFGTWEGLLVMLEQKSEADGDDNLVAIRGRAFQAKGTASAKALQWMKAGPVGGAVAE
jgi:hypothetical protein